MAPKLSIPARSIPDEKTLAAAADLDLQDKDGNNVKFGDLFRHQKTIVVFIRHFVCGSCQAYTQALNAVPQEALSAAQTRIVLVGCGEAKVIEAYTEMTGFPATNIYANPSRNIFHTLGMDAESTSTGPGGAERRSYMPKSDFMNAASSIGRALMRPSILGKQGNVEQLGGEFILGPGNVCSFASRMEHTGDHVEVADLMKAAGVQIA